MSFIVAWFREALRTYYIRDLQMRAFGSALDARIEYFDEEGSDDILNVIVTQTNYAGRAIQRVVKLTETLFLSLYLLIALVIAPTLTIFALVVLGGLTVLLRNVVEPGYEIGKLVAEANEQRQAAVQAGTQGIRPSVFLVWLMSCTRTPWTLLTSSLTLGSNSVVTRLRSITSTTSVSPSPYSFSSNSR